RGGGGGCGVGAGGTGAAGCGPWSGRGGRSRVGGRHGAISSCTPPLLSWVLIMALTCLLSWTCLVSPRYWHLLTRQKTSRYATAWSKPGSPSHAPVILVGQCIDQRNRRSAALAGHLN